MIAAKASTVAAAATAAKRGARQGAGRQLDGMVDLLGVPQGERWARVAGAMQRLDDERGRPWRLKLLLPDTPEEAAAVPRLVARLGDAGLAYDSLREPGGVQGIVVSARERAPDTVAA